MLLIDNAHIILKSNYVYSAQPSLKKTDSYSAS